MITNERRYSITRAELRRFEEAAAEQQRREPVDGIDPRIEKALVDGLLGQGETLREEVKRHEDLREGHVSHREIDGLRDLPTALIEARIAAGLTQKALAQRLEVAEQQVQRREADLYSGVGVDRLQEVADALGMAVRETVSHSVPV
ncbi:MAG TPA: helix-turn-helix transcriptional regulator [Solirubrobacterales bacterium]|nr:helix-turn-helix transcriptional regulator [Solirubrobacterales bacterium]